MELPDHEKITTLAEILGVTRSEAIGLVVSLWTQTARLHPNGDLSNVSDRGLSHMSRLENPESRHFINDTTLVEALVGARFLTASKKIHKWEERNGLTLSTARVSRFRERQRNAQRNAGETPVKREGNDKPTLYDDDDVNDDKKNPPPQPPQGGPEGAVPKKGKKRDRVDPLVDPSMVDPNVARLYKTFLEATSRTEGTYPLTTGKAAVLADLLSWGGSVERAETGVKKVGKSDHHRGRNATGKRYDTLDGKPFRTREAFVGWCEEAAPASDPAKINPQTGRPVRVEWHNGTRFTYGGSDDEPYEVPTMSTEERRRICGLNPDGSVPK